MVFWRMYKKQKRLLQEQVESADFLKEENIGIALQSSAESMPPVVPPNAMVARDR
jgi:hypothetical protein